MSSEELAEPTTHFYLTALKFQLKIFFQGRQLCKQERVVKACAERLAFEEAERRIEELENNQLKAESFSTEEIFYFIALEDDQIASCTCPGYTGSSLICKHMFLAHRGTNYVISQPQAVIPARRSYEPNQEETLQDQWAEKRRLVEKIQDGIQSLITVEYWHQAENVEQLDSISRDSLTLLLSATDGLRHMVRDTLLAVPEYATQR
ncbi:hypothetical protein M422DRAFT_273925 [Sphaerobolus stellatus SS14]|uniref:Unplaced genomic scaffold SPHSTscaffold_356, whole genome shotgun sequence n=1 Tax=Sphaerobolus stellatus (strain SS14) TaxID=990650 RepID=A0A0C9T800_SPHS4|nr:hypothetical protein M422DRAFT_273925 [Sphaerobolus stellatus SS14]